MKKLSWWFVFLTIISVLCFLILTSCWTSSSTLVDNPHQNKNSDIEKHPMSFVFDVPDSLLNNQEFLTCAISNIDMCIQESFYYSSDTDTIDCDMFLTDDARQSCNFTKLTEAAKEKLDASLCSTLRQDFLERCELEVLFTQAVNTNDTSLCENLNEFNTIDCNNRVVLSDAMSSLEIDKCDSIKMHEWESESYDKQACREEVEYLISISSVSNLDDWENQNWNEGEVHDTSFDFDEDSEDDFN